jgi:hypothetical protein
LSRVWWSFSLIRLIFFPMQRRCRVKFKFWFFRLNAFNRNNIKGIVSLLFCGMAMKRYMFPNLSLQSQRTTQYMFDVVWRLP